MVEIQGYLNYIYEVLKSTKRVIPPVGPAHACELYTFLFAATVYCMEKNVGKSSIDEI